ncbi:rhodanese-like domain-containing protein [Rhodobium gokarnense]|uniref:Rhodanese-related sulfurtransferase n=1 Tax=Rhodobium gokarnense TaxID=364296 RepID=A0ABT3HGQ3_9HYPH|nr:rhodanese-like domain-containing protein [Rhodobium gokarnense]MCW2309572.1 rhodanese-related sulfurtransferase [Rhodobium gokarnense]
MDQITPRALSSTAGELGENGIVDAPTAREEALAGRLLLVDIRTPMEWQRTGVGDAAEAISLQDPSFLQKVLDLIGEDKSKAVAVLCATGNRSSWLAGEMRRLGFTNVYDVNEGMMGSFSGPGWLGRGLPTERPA